MQKLIEGLLAYSRVTTKAQPFEPVNLSTVAHEVLTDLEVRIQNSGGRVEIGVLPTVYADPIQMRQLLQNLIANALKFHKEEQPPVVKVSANTSNDGDREFCRVTVEDNGIGFDEKYAERIFGVFERLHGRQEYEGSGIGLSVCRRIVERHGGNIMAKSAPGEGATFTIELPINQDQGGNNEG
jgi:light-regulated signal transduction histidine kinase (bacteriophytochrome)